MFTVNRKKGQKGFTLVEVIVVAVIVAALAAVAIPLYLSYVNDTRKNSAANAAGSVASFAGACRNAGGSVAPEDSMGRVATCTVNSSTIQIPADITITNTVPHDSITVGRILGRHVSSPAADTISFSY